jgi:cation diffusion facilitator family transporter
MASCDDGCATDLAQAGQRQKRTLIIVLLINAGMFVLEFSAGIVSQSTALMADSLDMLADALIYGLGLFALGRAAIWKTRAAMTSGILQLLLGIGVAVQAVIRMSVDYLPDSATMGVFGVLALIANTICFFLLMRYRDGDINMRATWLCTRNDMIINIGVLIAAGMVFWLSSPLPDLIIGLIIAAIVIHSAWGVIKGARAA